MKSTSILFTMVIALCLTASCGGRGVQNAQATAQVEAVETAYEGFVRMGGSIEAVPYDQIDFEALTAQLDDEYGEGEYMIWIFREIDPEGEATRIRYTDENGAKRYFDLKGKQAEQFVQAGPGAGDCFAAVLDPDAEGPYGRLIEVEQITRISPPRK